MDKIKSEHLSSQNSTPNKKTPMKSQNENYDQQGNQQNYQQQQQPKQRRSRSDNHNREFFCGCGKSYLSNAALYTHVKQKHGGVAQNGSQQPSASAGNAKSKPKKNELSNNEKSSQKQEEKQKSEQKLDASTVYEDILSFFSQKFESSSIQKIENNEGFDWILEVFPRHYFTKGTDYFKILKNLEDLIKQINLHNNQMNNDNHDNYAHSNEKPANQQQGNKSETQLNTKKAGAEENYGEENTYIHEQEGESVIGSPNNLKKIKKNFSGSTVNCVAKNSTATASFDDRHLDTHDNHHSLHNININKEHSEQDHRNTHELDYQTLDIYDMQRDLRVTSLNKIFSIFILNISSKVSQQAFIELLVFVTLLRKALNKKGWESCSSPLPYEQLRHYMRSPYGYLIPMPGHHIAALGTQNITTSDEISQLQKDIKKPSRKRKQTDNMTTAETYCGAQNKKGCSDQEINCMLQEEEEYDNDDMNEGQEQDENQKNDNQNEQQAKNENKNNLNKNKNYFDDKQNQNSPYINQLEFCEANCGQRITEISNSFIIECLPSYFKSAISNANELHVIGPSEEGMKNACYILQLFINWMYVFKFSESRLVFSDSSSAEDETEIKDFGEEQELQEKNKGQFSEKKAKKTNEHMQSHQDIEQELDNNNDISHDHLEGRNQNKFKTNLSGSNRKSNKFNCLYDELEDESKENRHHVNQYNNDIEMIGSRKQRKSDLEDNQNMMLHGDINNYFMQGNINAFSQFQSLQDSMKINNVFNAQKYYGTPNYLRAQSAANSTTYMNYSNRFHGGDHSTSFYNSNNSTTFYHPPTPVAYQYCNNYNTSYPRSNKYGDQETPKINGYATGNLSVKAGQVPMMYGFPMPQAYNGYTIINPMMYPQMQPLYYQQQLFLSPQSIMAQNSMGDLYNNMGINTGQTELN
ncbi:hypothetical protein ABPG72_015246 [Tetrahymena utriculariae]